MAVAKAAVHVALLRGINVGKSGRVTMPVLAAALIGDGIDVSSWVVQSGNLVIRRFAGPTESLGREIERSIASRLGISTRCLVRTDAQLRRLLATDPLERQGDDDSRYIVHICDPPLTSKVWNSFSSEIREPSHAVLSGGAVFQWCPRGVSGEQALSPLIEKRTASVVTARNRRTLNELIVRCADA
jgi:uncharacterized protein (DUF1697 family)